MSCCGAVTTTRASITPVASMSMTTARDPAVAAWSAMPAASPRRFRLIA